MRKTFLKDNVLGYFVLTALLIPIQVMANDETPMRENRWFVFGGLMNYHTRLEESEREIDEQINGVFGKLICGWREPQTFKDWSDAWLLWDGYVGFGRDISPKWDWCVDFGGGAGTVKNRETYHPLGLRLKSAIDFARTEAFVEGTIDCYPWGKPVWAGNDSAPTGSGIMNAVRSTRPYLSVVSGYNHQTAEADVRLTLPVLGYIVRQKQQDVYDLFYVCPRVSAEMPVSKNNFLNFTIGYAFFTEHPTEFNSVCIGTFFKHKF